MSKIFVYVPTYEYYCTGNVHEVYRKFPESRKFLYFLQSDVYKTLAPAVLDYEDSKSESWHRAKKIREVNSVNKPTRTLLFVLKILFILAAD